MSVTGPMSSSVASSAGWGLAANERVNAGCNWHDVWVHPRSSRHVAGPVRVRPGRNWHRSWPIRVDQRPPSFQSLIAPEGAAAEEDEVEAAAEEDVRASACAARTEFLVARHPMPPRRVRRRRVNTFREMVRDPRIEPRISVSSLTVCSLCNLSLYH